MSEILKISEADFGARLDRFLKKKLPSITQGFIQKALRKGDIKVSGKRKEANYRLKEDDIVEVKNFAARETKQPAYKLERDSELYRKNLEILQKNVIYKDKNIIAINKPAGLAAQGGTKVKVSVDALLDDLKFELDERPKLVHRIDKDTSGVMVLARNAKVAADLGKMFKEKLIEKTYITIVVGLPELREGKITAPILAKKSDGLVEKSAVDGGGQRAVTFYRVIDNAADKISLLEVKPVTGRMHQIRVHMAHIGCPVLSDGKYGGREAFINDLNETMHLHAWKILIPYGNKNIEIKAELSPHIKETIKQIGFNFKG